MVVVGAEDVTQGYAGLDTVAAYGTATNPTAGTAIATIAANKLGAGVYEIDVAVGLSGTIAAGDRDNFELMHGSTVVVQLLAPEVTNGILPVRHFPRITVAASEAITVNAVGNASGASAVYRAVVSATRVN